MKFDKIFRQLFENASSTVVGYIGLAAQNFQHLIRPVNKGSDMSHDILASQNPSWSKRLDHESLLRWRYKNSNETLYYWPDPDIANIPDLIEEVQYELSIRGEQVKHVQKMFG